MGVADSKASAPSPLRNQRPSAEQLGADSNTWQTLLFGFEESGGDLGASDRFLGREGLRKDALDEETKEYKEYEADESARDLVDLGLFTAPRGPKHARRPSQVNPGRRVRQLKGYSQAIQAHAEQYAVAFSPNGVLLAAACADLCVRVWDMSAEGEAAQRPVCVLRGHEEAVTSLAFSPDGKLLSSGSADYTVRSWNMAVAASATMVRLLEGHEGAVMGIDYSPSGKHLATASKDKTACLWDVSGTADVIRPRPFFNLLRRMRGHRGRVTGVSFSPDGEMLVTSSSDRTLRVWDLTSDFEDAVSERPMRVLRGHLAEVTCVVFAPDSRSVVSGSLDNTIRFWDVRADADQRRGRGGPRADLPRGAARVLDLGHQAAAHDKHGVTSLNFAPTGDALASGSDDGTIHVWDVSAGAGAVTEPVRTIDGKGDTVSSVSFSRDGEVLAAGFLGRRILAVWDLAAEDDAATEPVRTLGGHRDTVNTIQFSPRGGVMASGSHDGTVRIWDMKARSNASWGATRILGRQIGGRVLCLAFSPMGTTLAAGYNDAKIRFWDVEAEGDAGREPLRVLGGRGSGVIFAVAWSPDGKLLASGSSDKVVRVYSVFTSGVTGKECALRGHEEAVFALDFSPDGRTLASASYDRTVRIWDLAALDSVCDADGGADAAAQLRVLDAHEGAVYAVRYAPDGAVLASCAADGKVMVWDMRARGAVAAKRPVRALGAAAAGVSDAAFSLSFSPRGTILASGHKSGVVRIWDMQAKGAIATEPLRVMGERRSQISSVAFSPDGQVLATSEERTVRLRGLPEPRLSFAFVQPFPRHAQEYWFEHDLADPLSWGAKFRWGATRALVRRHPLVLVESSATTSSLLQWAIMHERRDFLDEVGKWGVSPKVLVQAILANAPPTAEGDGDAKPVANGAFVRAMETRSEPCLAWLFETLAAALRPEALHLNDREEYIQEAAHQPDAFLCATLGRALRSYPRITTNFLARLELVPAYAFVAGGLKKFNFERAKNVRKNILAGSELRSPRGFWKALLAEEEFHRARRKRRGAEKHGGGRGRYLGLGRGGGKKQAQGEPAAAFLLPLRGVGRADSRVLEGVISACDELQKYDVMDTPVVEALIQFKWQTFVRRRFLRDLWLAIAQVLLFSATAIGLPQAAAAADGQLGGAEGWRSELAVAVAFLAGALAALLLLFFAAHELQGMVQSGPYEHLRGDIWNCVDFVSIIAQGLTLFLLVVDYRRAGGGVSVHGDFQASSTCASIALPPAWFSLLYFMLGFEGSGMLARMVIEITRGVRDFVIILAVVVIGFALSFYVLFQAGSMQHDPMTVGDVDVEDEVFGYRNPLAALVSGFALMLGDFDRDEFSASANESLMNVLFVVFQVFVTIIMLNLLIAIMGDIFDKVQEHARAHYLYAKAKIVVEYETALKKKRRPDRALFPEWIQVLKPKRAEENEGELGSAAWAGRIAALKRQLETVRRDVSANVKDVEAVVTGMIDERMDKVDARVLAIDDHLVTLSDRMGKLEQLLARAAGNPKPQEEAQGSD